MAQAGMVLNNKYEILKLVGQGGMSNVYLAMDNTLNKYWAVKELRKQSAERDNRIIVESFLAEADLMKRLDHPYAPRIVDIIDEDGNIYVVMDYIEGKSLNVILKEKGPLPEEKVIEWAGQLCDILGYLHSLQPPIIYQDMKPSNIMLRPEGSIKVIDFGTAREYGKDPLPAGDRLGTKAYAAPEQSKKGERMDARTDIYCLGTTLYHLVTGQLPAVPASQSYPVRKWNPALSGGLEKVIAKCMKEKPEERYQSFEELRAVLDNINFEDEAYKEKLKRKLAGFALSCTVAVLGLLLGIVGQIMEYGKNNSTFSAYLNDARAATSDALRREKYEAAIAIKNTNLDAYMGLVNSIKSDAVMEESESRQISRLFEKYGTELEQTQEYDRLCFEIGKLYWYYYDYNDTGDEGNTVTRMISAMEWFSRVLKNGREDENYYRMASCYYNIGEFFQNIAISVTEGDERGKYERLWRNIVELDTLIRSSADNEEIVEYQYYWLLVHSIENYARKLKADGIGQEQMSGLLEKCKASLENSEATSDTTQSLKDYVTGRLSEAEKAIENAFR